MKTFRVGNRLAFTYTNHRNETARREIVFHGMDYGDNVWYPERQWFLRGWDSSRQEYRSFALARINPEEIEVLP